MEFVTEEVSDLGPAQDIAPLIFYHDGIYVSGELWGYWWRAFPGCSAGDMFESVKHDIDDVHAEFTRSLAQRGPPPSS